MKNATFQSWKLDIGCGNKKTADVIGLDINRKAKNVDIIADARYLPIKTSTFDHVYSSHVIEHISHCETKQTLQEWLRVLKRNGLLEIRCPDFRASCLRFAIKPSWHDNRGLFGMQTDEGQYHTCGFSYGTLKNILKKLGIRNIKRKRDWNKIIPWVDLHVTGKKE